MITDIQVDRWKRVERLNGKLATWWRYNRLTIVLAIALGISIVYLTPVRESVRVECRAV